MKKSIYIFLIITFISSSCYSHDWKYISFSEENDEYYLDIQSIKKENTKVNYFVLVNYSKKLGGIAYSVIANLEGHCYSYEIRVLNDTYYSKNMGKGAKVAGSNIPDKDFTKYPETSLFGSVLKEACNLLD